MRPRRFKARKTGETEKIKDVIECHPEVWYYYIVKKSERAGSTPLSFLMLKQKGARKTPERRIEQSGAECEKCEWLTLVNEDRGFCLFPKCVKKRREKDVIECHSEK